MSYGVERFCPYLPFFQLLGYLVPTSIGVRRAGLLTEATRYRWSFVRIQSHTSDWKLPWNGESVLRLSSLDSYCFISSNVTSYRVGLLPATNGLSKWETWLLESHISPLKRDKLAPTHISSSKRDRLGSRELHILRVSLACCPLLDLWHHVSIKPCFIWV